MRMLVTGAGGFLGKQVVRALLERGHAVRAQVRSAASSVPEVWRSRVEIVCCDLNSEPAMERLFIGVDVLVHLAATLHGDASSQFAGTVTASEKLLAGMRRAGVTRHMVLASSFSVYDWTAAKSPLSEDSAVEPDPAGRDGYTRAKIAQEQAVRKIAGDNGWTLTVLRPGLIYGPGAMLAASAGVKAGKIFAVVAPSARLRLTHVENCAAAFADAAEKGVAGTFNIVDDERVTAWQYAGRLSRKARGTWRVIFPYNAGLIVASVAEAVASILPGARQRRMPGLLRLGTYRARFRPFEYDNTRAKAALGWKPKPLFESGSDVI